MTAFKIVRTSRPHADGQIIGQEQVFVAHDIGYRSEVHCDTSYPSQSWATCRRVDNGVLLTTMHPQHETGLDFLRSREFDAAMTPEPFRAIFAEFRRVAEEITS